MLERKRILPLTFHYLFYLELLQLNQLYCRIEIRLHSSDYNSCIQIEADGETTFVLNTCLSNLGLGVDHKLFKML